MTLPNLVPGKVKDEIGWLLLYAEKKSFQNKLLGLLKILAISRGRFFSFGTVSLHDVGHAA